MKKLLNIFIVVGVLIFWRPSWRVDKRELLSVFNKGIAYADGDIIFQENEVRGELGGGGATVGEVKGESTPKSKLPYYLGGLVLLLAVGWFFLKEKRIVIFKSFL